MNQVIEVTQIKHYYVTNTQLLQNLDLALFVDREYALLHVYL